MLDDVAQACSDVGYSSYTSKTGDGTTLAGGQYLMIENRFEVDCCGVVTSWSISAHSTGSLALQIWRPAGGTSYQLVGENVVNVASTGDNSFTVASSEYISVQSGDQVGWYTSGAAIVDWSNNPGASGTTNYLTSGTVATAVGATISFSGTTDEDYAVYATVSSGTTPTFTNLPATVSFGRNALSVGVTVYAVVATDSDGNDTLTYSLQSASPSGAFSLDSATGDVTPTSSTTTPGTYTLTIRVTDTCGNTNDQDLTILVTNAAPELYGLPVVVDISESAVDETLLHLINVTDPDGDSVTCTVTSAPSGPFTEKYSNGAAPGEILQGIYLQANPNLDYDTTSSYTITVSCTDGDETVSGIVYVYVVKNNVPVITNLQNVTSITSDTPSNTAIFEVTEDTAIGATVFTLSVYDEDGGTSHTFSTSFSPAAGAGLFGLENNSSHLTLLAKLNSFTQATSYNITVEASDGQAVSAPSWLALEVVDVNEAPVLYQADYQVQIEESPAGSTFSNIGFNVNDPDGDNLTYAFAPGSNSTDGFSIASSSGEISLTLDFDREDTGLGLSSRVWLVSISDPAGLAATATLTVSILDKEDNVPRLSSTSYSGSVSSDARVGQVVTTASASDADATAANRVLEYSVSGTTVFNVDGSGNIVVFTGLGDYVDTQHTFSLTVRNPGSASSDTATVSVYVTKAGGDGFFDQAENIALVTIASVVGLCLLLGLAYLAIKAYINTVMTTPPYKTTQVAPTDTKLPHSARSRSYTRSTVVTPSDIRAIDAEWSAWNHSWY
ncbi:cadherin-23 [Elysia marginata]|uniref:Cadherin-23 n=1 Tax=Elysia marginata TaxID=1093978 RepID=A0AAV4EQR9_9GAST|nr:cadherin-23 [Elysia marginata]